MPAIDEVEESKIAVSGNKVYLYGFMEDENFDLKPCMYRLTWNDKNNSFRVENLNKSAKKIAVEPKNMAMTGSDSGVFIVGPREKTDERYDTYFIGNRKKTVDLFEKSACYHTIYMPMTLYNKGVFYVMGVNCTEPDTLFFRSTVI